MHDSQNKFCTQCGSKLSEGSGFCTQCGARVIDDAYGDSPTSVHKLSDQVDEVPANQVQTAVVAPPVNSNVANSYVQEQPVKANSRHRVIIVGLIAAIAIVAIAAIIGIVVFGIGSDSESEEIALTEIVQESPEDSSEESEKAPEDSSKESAKATDDSENEEEGQQGLKTPWGDVFDTKKVYWKVDGKEAYLFDASTKETVGLVYTTYNSDKGHDTKTKTYIIGKAKVGTSKQNVHLALYYFKNGKLMHWAEKGGKTAVQSGSLKLDDIASAIELNTASGLKRLTSSDFKTLESGGSSTSSSKSSASGSTDSANSNKSPVLLYSGPSFYGAWIGAYTTESEAKKATSAARSKGFSAYYVYTPNWKNLGSEGSPYQWCVTAGICSSDSKAKTLAKKARNAGYSGAYPKFSGEHHI